MEKNLSWHEREARQNFTKCKQVQKHPDDIEYWIHLQEHLNHPAYCKHCLYVMTSVAFGDLSRLTHTTFFSKLSKTGTRIRITNNPKTTYNECAILYGKTRVKCVRASVPKCANTVFSRIFHKSAYFYRVLQCKTRIPRICKNIRVLPCKSHIWTQNGPQNGPQNGSRNAGNACFTEVLSHRSSKNTVFYRVKWTSDRPKWPCWKIWKMIDLVT